MKKLHSILPVMVVACLLMLLPLMPAEAAQGKPGQTVTVTFSFNEIRGLDGVFSFSNEAILENISYSSSFQGVRFNNNKLFYSTMDSVAKTGTVTVTATIKEDAAVGSSCTITLGDINITDANTNSVYSGSKSEVVSVVKEPVVTKAPAEPTATPASQSGGESSSQNSVTNQGQTQNVVNNNSSGSSENKTITEAPAQNVVNNNKNTVSSSKNTEIPATSDVVTASAESTEEPVGTTEIPEDSIEANTDILAKDSKDKTGSNIWLILFLISLLANLLLVGFLLWRKRKKTENTIIEDDTPIVDYDIDEDFDDDMI